LDVSEFDLPFLRFDILLKHGAIILRVQGFNVVSIIGLNMDLAQVGDLAIQVTHSHQYVHENPTMAENKRWSRSWTLVARHQDIYYFSTICIQSFEH